MRRCTSDSSNLSTTALMIVVSLLTTGCNACSDIRDFADVTIDLPDDSDGASFGGDTLDVLSDLGLDADAFRRPDGPIFHELPADLPDGRDAAQADPGAVELSEGDDASQEAHVESLDAVRDEPGDGLTAPEGIDDADGNDVLADAVSSDGDAPPNDGDGGSLFDGPSEATCAPNCGLVVPPGFVLVEPGTFLMGSPLDEPGRGNDELQHQVTLTHRFLLAAHEVTQGQWRALMGAPHATSIFANCGDTCPAENVNWWSALRYCNDLSAQEGLDACYTLQGCSGQPGMDLGCAAVSFAGPACLGYRLPTEAEWEYAARAGTITALSTGPLPLEHLELLSPEADGIGWYGGNSGVAYAGAWDCSSWKAPQYPALTCGTHPAQQKAPNAWGLSDLSGNVWEWCWDAWAPYPTATAVIDPQGAADPSFRVLRGGSWMTGAARVRSANRGRYEPGVRNGATGFRVARTVP